MTTIEYGDIKLIANAALKQKNTLAIEATAEYYYSCTDLEALKKAVLKAVSQDLKIKVLGGGSNVVLAPIIRGLTLQYLNADLTVLHESKNDVLVRVGAGYNWHHFVIQTLKNGWFGLENLALIPGTVGAAPVQNIGAYGVEVKQFIRQVDGIWLKDATPFSLSSDECQFSYRESCFKQSLNNKTIITSVEFLLSKTPCVNVSYSPLTELAKKNGTPNPELLAKWVIETRQAKLPDPNDKPNAGSFFKNPIVSQEQYEALLLKYEKMPSYRQENGVKIAAGWLIDQLGLKGAPLGNGVSVNDKQALVLINDGGTGEDVQAAANEIIRRVAQCYGIELEQEPRYFE